MTWCRLPSSNTDEPDQALTNPPTTISSLPWRVVAVVPAPLVHAPTWMSSAPAVVPAESSVVRGAKVTASPTLLPVAFPLM